MEEILIKSLAASSRKSGGVEVSATDKREYRLVTLENGVVCLIISDVEADQCACACSVDVGSFADPADALGLAHFLEHLLFLGSEKYPLPNETERHLTMNGGESNAYTDDEQTNYHFDVLPAGFDEALDRFAQFFVAPTFEPSMTARELMAVDSEMQQNKQSDSWRLHRVLQSQAHGGSPCPTLLATAPCSAQDCPVHCAVSPWSTWASCSLECGAGQAVRVRAVTRGAADGDRGAGKGQVICTFCPRC